MYAIVGDWVSYGSQLTLKDLHIENGVLKAATHGGQVVFDMENKTFENNNEDLEHIDILTYYVNSDGSEWFSYASGRTGISVIIPDVAAEYYNFDFANAIAFTGNENQVLVTYMNDFNPEIAHFVKNANRYIFQDTYNQFPGDPSAIYDIELFGDSLFLATDKGLIKSWLYNANLKPESAWSAVSLESDGPVSCLYVQQDSLLVVDQNNDIYSYSSGVNEKRIDSDETINLIRSDGPDVYFSTRTQIFDLENSQAIFTSENDISSFIVDDGILWVAETNRGLTQVNLSSGKKENYIPNTMLYTKSNALAITSDQKVMVCGLGGISVLDNDYWHNYVYSINNESTGHEETNNYYSADTLNIAWREGGETAVYDAMVTSQNQLWNSITDISIYKYSYQTDMTEGPGALIHLNLDDHGDYTVYDTSDSVINGTQGLGGAPQYLKMSGMTEDRYGNVWVINAHTLAGETLIKIRPNGEIRKYSSDESGGRLQVLARELIFDDYGRLWIANEAHQADIPRTTGGITIYDPNSGVWDLITTADGLISNNIYSIDKDPLTGNMWVATAAGVQMIRTPTTIGTSSDITMNPPIDGLSGMVPVKIRIDPRGNKWILTQSQGVQIYMSNNRWFDEGSGLSSENSGLLDNVVYDLAFDRVNGYAYLLTASGLNRFEIPWTEERTNMNDVIIFPQPFHPGTDPYLAIDGIADQSQVRISTIDGRVLIRFEADAIENLEKQIVWDGLLPNGEYIPRGVYLVFITNIDGLKKTLKFAVE